MNKAKIGTWITTYNPSALDVISKCNFDWICVDMEHSSITLEQLENLLNVLDKNGSNSFVRVSENNKTEIKKETLRKLRHHVTRERNVKYKFL